MACFITGQSVEVLCADFASTLTGRELEDDAFVAFRMSAAVRKLQSPPPAAMMLASSG
jgi:hypothetical protein